MLRSSMIVSAAMLFAVTSLACAADRSSDRYVKRNIPQGGNRHAIVLVPAGDRIHPAGELPHALTGRDAAAKRQPVKSPSHPRGPRND